VAAVGDLFHSRAWKEGSLRAARCRLFKIELHHSTFSVSWPARLLRSVARAKWVALLDRNFPSAKRPWWRN